MACLLIADTDRSLGELIRDSTHRGNHRVVCAYSATEAIRAVQNLMIDLMVLDVSTCIGDGLEAFTALVSHAQTRRTPILFLTYFGNPVDHLSREVPLPDLESAHYLRKPFSIQNFEALVVRILGGDSTELPTEEAHIVKLGSIYIYINFDSFRVKGKSGEVALTPREFEILEYLIKHSGEVVSGEKIYYDTWERSFRSDNPKVVRWHLKNLGAKLNQCAGQSIQVIQTVPRHGYTIPNEI